MCKHNQKSFLIAVAMYLMSLAQLLILFDHILLAILFLIALFCVVAAVTASFSYSSTMRKRTMVGEERTDTCYTTRTGGTVLLLDTDWQNVV